MLGLGLGIGLGLSLDSPTQANTNPALGMANLINVVGEFTVISAVYYDSLLWEVVFNVIKMSC